MTHNYTDEVMQIFKRLVAAKRAPNYHTVNGCYHDLGMLADIEAKRQKTTENKLLERF